MKNLVGLLVIGLIISSCGGSDNKKNDEELDTAANIGSKDLGGLKIAFYNQDSLFLHFDYYVTRDSIMTKKGLAFQSELQRRSQELDAYIAANEQKMRSGLLSENEIMSVQQVIQQKQGALMQYQEENGARIEQETVRELEAIGNKINQFGKDYCEENGIDMLLVKAAGGQFNYISPSMDVTKAFTAYLNKRQSELEAEIAE